MLQVINTTPFAAAMLVLADQHGVDTAYVFVRATFGLSPKSHVANEQVPLVFADEFWGEPSESSLKAASEVCIGKVGTDVVVIGEACAPDERPITEIVAGIRIGSRTHLAQVFGDREWLRSANLTVSAPKPFVRMPLVYERAFGGTHVLDAKAGTYLAEARNPVGRGFWGKRTKNEYAEVGVPNIVRPSQPSRPVGFGFVAPGWQPRVAFAGTYDETWQKARAPYFPADFDLRYFNVAPPELIFEAGLRGGEQVIVTGMSPRGKQGFRVPACDFEVGFQISGKRHRAELKLVTVLIEPTIDRVCLTYMASAPCNKKVLQVETADIGLTRGVGALGSP